MVVWRRVYAGFLHDHIQEPSVAEENTEVIHLVELYEQMVNRVEATR